MQGALWASDLILIDNPLKSYINLMPITAECSYWYVDVEARMLNSEDFSAKKLKII